MTDNSMSEYHLLIANYKKCCLKNKLGFQTTFFYLRKIRRIFNIEMVEQYYWPSLNYSGLTLNQYGVASPCRTICIVCGFIALS